MDSSQFHFSWYNRSKPSSFFRQKLLQQEIQNKLLGHNVPYNTTFMEGLYIFERFDPINPTKKLEYNKFMCFNQYCHPDLVNAFVWHRRQSLNYFRYHPAQIMFIFNQLQRAGRVNAMEISTTGLCPLRLTFPITSTDPNLWRLLAGCLLRFRVLRSYQSMADIAVKLHFQRAKRFQIAGHLFAKD